MTEAELLTQLVERSDQLYQLHLVVGGFLIASLGWIAGHQR